MTTKEMTLIIILMIAGFIAALVIAVKFHIVFVPFLTWLFGSLAYGAYKTAKQ